MDGFQLAAIGRSCGAAPAWALATPERVRESILRELSRRWRPIAPGLAIDPDSRAVRARRKARADPSALTRALAGLEDLGQAGELIEPGPGPGMRLVHMRFAAGPLRRHCSLFERTVGYANGGWLDLAVGVAPPEAPAGSIEARVVASHFLAVPVASSPGMLRLDYHVEVDLGGVLTGTAARALCLGFAWSTLRSLARAAERDFSRT